MDKHFKELFRNNDSNEPFTKVYNNLLESLLFNVHEKLLLIYLMSQSAGEINSVNTATISFRDLCEYIKMSKPTVSKHIKTLEEKGVLIKQNNSTPNNQNVANTYKVLNYVSVWDCKSLNQLKEETDKIKSEVLMDG